MRFSISAARKHDRDLFAALKTPMRLAGTPNDDERLVAWNGPAQPGAAGANSRRSIALTESDWARRPHTTRRADGAAAAINSSQVSSTTAESFSRSTCAVRTRQDITS